MQSKTFATGLSNYRHPQSNFFTILVFKRVTKIHDSQCVSVFLMIIFFIAFQFRLTCSILEALHLRHNMVQKGDSV